MAPLQTSEDVVGMIRSQRTRIRALGVTRLGVFGSFAQGRQGPGSDVDVLVDFDPRSKTFDNFMNLAFLLEGLLERRVELVTASSLSPYIGPRILKEVVDVPLGA